MIINQQNLTAAFTGFKTVFNSAFTAAPVTWDQVATQAPSSTRQEVYAWLGQTTKFREWVGGRVIQGLATHDFTIKNKRFENTVAILRDDFEDDTYGIYNPFIAQLGQDTKTLPDTLVYNQFKAGTTTPCYDGQFFFDTDHPGYDANGGEISVSNYVAGAGPAWYLLDTTKVVKPFIYQLRRAFQFVSRTDPTDPRVFDFGEFVYGVDGRCNVGVGLWQLAYRSEEPLTPETYGAARAAMGAVRMENGDSMAVTPNLLVVPPALEGAANTILKADVINATSNVWKGTATPLVAPRLA